MKKTLMASAMAAAASLTYGAGAAMAGDFEARLAVSAESRFYTQEPQYDDQTQIYVQPSVAVEPELDYRFENGTDRLTFVGFGRYDPNDTRRTHVDVREAYWLHEGDGWDSLIGINRVFWGVTESRHLVNIVNQIDGVEDIDNEDFLGEPMINLNIDSGFGRFGFYVMPGFRERTFVEDDARLRGPLPIDESRSEIEGDWDKKSVDFALRYENTFGPADIGLSYSHGISREPWLTPRVNSPFPLLEDAVNDYLADQNSFDDLDDLRDSVCDVIDCDGGLISELGDLVLAPRYDKIDQIGLDLQAAQGDWLFKLESMVRFGHAQTIFAAVGGFEYTFFDVGETGADVGLLAEYLFDSRDPDRIDVPPTIYDNDVFVGSRIALNDIGSTNLLGGAVVDVDNQEIAASIEASTRIVDNLVLGVEGRFFFNEASKGLLSSVAKDDFVNLRMTWSF